MSVIAELIERPFYDYNDVAKIVRMSYTAVRIRYREYRIRNNEYFE